MSETVLLPGSRAVRASLDRPSEAATDDSSARCVVACPPHPQLGGSRSDGRLRAVSDALTDRGLDCLRFDYGPWDEGAGERRDAGNAVAWATERYERVGLFGYSFGASVALLTAADESDVGAVSALAPGARISDDLDVVAALDRIACPAQVVYGERDGTVDWEPVVERARELGFETEALAADHHFVGQRDRVAERVVEFLVDSISD